MPFKLQTEPDYKCIWVEGPPNSGKTTSLRTIPGKIGVISFPGEKGSASIPYGPNVIAFVWEDDGTPVRERNTVYYQRMWREVEDKTIELITGKHGPLNGVVADGVHKLYQLGLAIATDGESEKLQAAFKEIQTDKGVRLEGDFDPRCYVKSHRLIWEYVNMVAASKVPWRIFTSWAEQEKDDPDDLSRNAPKHLMPDLPGKAARRVLGEVGIVLHALINAKNEYVWQTKPGGKVYGAGIKGNLDAIAKVPTFIPQNFAELETLLCVPVKTCA